MIRNEVGRPPVDLGWASSWYVILFPSMLLTLFNWTSGKASGSWMSVSWWWQFDWSFTCLIAPIVTTISIILSFSKIQNGVILMPAYRGCPGRWPLNESRWLSLCQSTPSTHLTDVTNEVNSHGSVGDALPPSPPDSASSCQQPYRSSQSLFCTPLRFSHSLYQHPLPAFHWADGSDVWRAMLDKESRSTFRRDPDMFERHAGLDARMRSILLDWLIEVSIAFDVM